MKTLTGYVALIDGSFFTFMILSSPVPCVKVIYNFVFHVVCPNIITGKTCAYEKCRSLLYFEVFTKVEVSLVHRFILV